MWGTLRVETIYHFAARHSSSSSTYIIGTEERALSECAFGSRRLKQVFPFLSSDERKKRRQSSASACGQSCRRGRNVYVTDRAATQIVAHYTHTHTLN